jgi:NDP-sugar pyrophosphorylase family protein
LVFPDKTEIGDKIYQTIIGVKKYLPNNFLMLNTDICSSLDLIQLTDNHLENYKNGLLYTVATTHLNQGAKKCGLIEGIDSDGHYRFLPKGHGREQGWIDTGFVATSQEFINELERLTSENKDWRYHDARTKIFENGKGGVSIQPNRSWFDIGTPEDYQIAVEHVKKILTNQL